MTGKRKATSDLSSKTADDDTPATSNKRIELEELVLVPPTKEEEVSDLESDVEDDEDDEGDKLPRLDGDHDVRKVLPDGFSPETHPHIISQMIDEVVILMKEVRDFLIFEGGNTMKRTPKNVLKNQLRFMEIEFNLPKGTLKESTVHSRLKSYKLPSKSHLSLLDRIEVDLFCHCVEKIRTTADQEEEDADKILNYRIIMNFAKALLQQEQDSLSATEQEKYNWTRDVVKLDERWLQGFLSQAIAALPKCELPSELIAQVRSHLDRVSQPKARRGKVVADAVAPKSNAPLSNETVVSTPTKNKSALASNKNKDLVRSLLDDDDDCDDENIVIPADFDPIRHSHILSKILDEVVMLMKDARDEVAFSCVIVGKRGVPKDTLTKIIQATEKKYDLPPGTIKESTVQSRLRSYKVVTSSDSLLSEMEELLLETCVATALEGKHHNGCDPSDTLDCAKVIELAKIALRFEHNFSRAVMRKRHHLALDYMKLDRDWYRDFMTRSRDGFAEYGVFIRSFA